MATIFTKIINGEIPCYKVAEDDNYFAFLDINPNAKGHTLCIPKKKRTSYSTWTKKPIPVLWHFRER